MLGTQIPAPETQPWLGNGFPARLGNRVPGTQNSTPAGKRVPGTDFPALLGWEMGAGNSGGDTKARNVGNQASTNLFWGELDAAEPENMESQDLT